MSFENDLYHNKGGEEGGGFFPEDVFIQVPNKYYLISSTFPLDNFIMEIYHESSPGSYFPT